MNLYNICRDDIDETLKKEITEEFTKAERVITKGTGYEFKRIKVNIITAWDESLLQICRGEIEKMHL